MASSSLKDACGVPQGSILDPIYVSAWNFFQHNEDDLCNYTIFAPPILRVKIIIKLDFVKHFQEFGSTPNFISDSDSEEAQRVTQSCFYQLRIISKISYFLFAADM